MQKTGDNCIWYTYDENGLVTGFRYNGAEYYYFRNAQNDIIGIVNSSGVVVANYTYDSWGNHIAITDGNGNNVASNPNHIANINPFRYRGYYYDSETGLYYLNSRYYDANVGRFLNADGYVSTGQGVTGNNMFAYCGNNPIIRQDPSGQGWGIVFAVVLVIGLVVSLSGCSAKTDSPSPSPSPTPSPSPSPSPTPSPSPSPTPSPYPTPSSQGISVHKGSIRICTDGSDGTKVDDNDWWPETAYSHNGNYLDAYTVPYVVIPMEDQSAKLGDCALLINHDTGMSVMCVIGDRGPKKNGWGEVSIAAIWDTGNPEHMTATHASGLSNNYEIIIYPGVKYNNWKD